VVGTSAAVRGWAGLRGLTQVALLALAAFGGTHVWHVAGLVAWSSDLARSLLVLIVLQSIGLRVLLVHRRAWRFVSLDDALALLAGLTLGTGDWRLRQERARVRRYWRTPPSPEALAAPAAQPGSPAAEAARAPGTR
jgi:hypothetical protein